MGFHGGLDLYLPLHLSPVLEVIVLKCSEVHAGAIYFGLGQLYQAALDVNLIREHSFDHVVLGHCKLIALHQLGVAA